MEFKVKRESGISGYINWIKPDRVSNHSIVAIPFSFVAAAHERSLNLKRGRYFYLFLPPYFLTNADVWILKNFLGDKRVRLSYIPKNMGNSFCFAHTNYLKLSGPVIGEYFFYPIGLSFHPILHCILYIGSYDVQPFLTICLRNVGRCIYKINK